MKRNIRNQLPSLTDDKIQLVLGKVLSVLNEGDIKAIQELETIGKKRAQDIINYRVEQRIKNVSCFFKYDPHLRPLLTFLLPLRSSNSLNVDSAREWSSIL